MAVEKTTEDTENTEGHVESGGNVSADAPEAADGRSLEMPPNVNLVNPVNLVNHVLSIPAAWWQDARVTGGFARETWRFHGPERPAEAGTPTGAAPADGRMGRPGKWGELPARPAWPGNAGYDGELNGRDLASQREQDAPATLWNRPLQRRCGTPARVARMPRTKSMKRHEREMAAGF